jgi:hypothetical protein
MKNRVHHFVLILLRHKSKGEKADCRIPGSYGFAGFPWDPLDPGYEYSLDCSQGPKPEIDCVCMLICFSAWYYFQSISEQNKFFRVP